MPKQLAALQKEFDDILRRATPMLEDLDKRAADMGKLGATKGVQLMLGQGIDALADRVQTLGAATASDPVAANDPEVQTLLREIADMKATCRKISTEYWMNAQRLQAISKEAKQLKTKVDLVIGQKAAKLTQSKSLQGLRKLSVDLNTYADDLNKTSTKAFKKPDHPFFQ